MNLNFENITSYIQSIGIIPVRLGSTRLPNKPIIEVNGKCLVQRVWEGACQSNILQRVVIATDSETIAEKCFDFGAEFVLTDKDLSSGTDRIWQAYERLNENADIIVNIQGDEPLINGQIIDNLIYKFVKSKADVGTVIKKIENYNEIFDPNVVKVALKSDMTAMDFTREPFPFFRDLPKELWLKRSDYWKHIGIYAYKKEILNKFVNLSQTQREKNERLEQLRLLERGYRYYCVETKENLIGVDTKEDLEKVRQIFQQKVKVL